MSQKFLIIIAGPTAVGKTKTAIEIAKYFDTEIISADSRQLFKELNIGVARPSAEELQQVKHHFIANKSINDYVSAGTFEEEVLEILNTLFQTKKYVVLCGGTGFYINAVLYGFDEMPPIDEQIRQKLNLQFQQEGIELLQQQLKTLDNETYQSIDIKNPQRIIRALEICIGTGKPYSSFKTKKTVNRDFIPIKIGLNLPKDELNNRINLRVDKMMADGFLEEAKLLIENRNNNALQTVGYKELFDYLDGKTNLADAVELIKLHTRQYAKRQLTFFNKHKDYSWFEPNQIQKIIEMIDKQNR